LIAALSPKLALGLAAFGAGLAIVGLVTVVLLLRVERHAAERQDVARRVLRNSAFPLTLQFVVRAIDLAFVVALYHLLAQQQKALGDYELAALLVSLYLGTVSEWGLGVLLTREVARDRRAIGQSFGTALLLRMGLSVAALPMALLVIAIFGGLHRIGLFAEAISGQGATLIGILILTLLPSAIGGAVTSLFLATERPIVPALANLLNNVISTALRLLAVLLGFGVLGVAWGAVMATILNAAVFLWLLRRDFGWPGWQWDRSLARMMLAAAFPLMLNNLLVGVFFRFDSFIIKGYWGSDAVANYAAAYKVAPLALIVPPIVVNALFPLFSRQAIDDRSALLRGYRLTLRVLLLGAFPLAAVISIFSTPVIALIAGPEWVAASAPVLALLVWFVPFSYVNGIAQYVLIALNRQAAITRAFALTALFNLVGNLVLAPILGLHAAALMTIASEIVLYLPFHRVLETELGAAPLMELLWRPAVATVACVAAMVLLRPLPILAVLAGIAIYGSVLWSLGTFTAEDRILVRRLAGRPGEAA
jgi:O-antigen/teichoic acid export membrane protein